MKHPKGPRGMLKLLESDFSENLKNLPFLWPGVHTYNSSIQEAEAGELPQVQGQPGLCNEFRTSPDYIVKPCVKK